jgi:hypothetical protein
MDNRYKGCPKKTTVCHKVKEADAEKTEPDREIMQSVAEHQMAPKEDAIVKPVKGRKKRHRGRKLAAGRHGEPKELTRSDCGSGRKLAAACRKVSSCATVAWQKRNLFKKNLDRGKLCTAQEIDSHRNEEMSGMQQWHKGLRAEAAAMRQNENK